MANLVLNGKSIDSIDDIAENFVEDDVLREFRSGSLASWLEEYGYEEELERVRSIKPTASSIRVLAGISEALNLDDDVIAEAAARREDQQRKEEAARKARKEQQRKDEEERQRRASEAEQKILKEESVKLCHEREQEVQNQSVQNIVGQADASCLGTIFGSHYIDPEKCVACGSCKAACPADAITEGTPYTIDPDKCVACGVCAVECPAEAICEGDEQLPNNCLPTPCYANGALFERVRDIVVEQLNVNPAQVTPDATFIDDLGADSLDSVELIMAFEEEFGAALSEEDAEKLTTVGKVVAYLQSKGY